MKRATDFKYFYSLDDDKMDADEAANYVKRANKIRYQHFGRGYVSESAMQRGRGPAAGNNAISTAPQPPATPLGVLPPKKNKKRQRGTSPDPEGPEITSCPAATMTSSPSTAVPVGRKPKLSLLDKWFPGNTLKQATVEVCHAPTPEMVQGTVARMGQAREAMILLRAHVEDLEEVLDDLRDAAQLSTETYAWGPTEVRAIVRRGDSCRRVAEALSHIAATEAAGVRAARKQLWSVLHKRSLVRLPATLSVKKMHDFLNAHGPEADGGAPATRDFVWLSSAETTAFFTVLTQRFLRGVRESTKIATGEQPAAPAEPELSEQASPILYINDAEEECGNEEAAAQRNTGEAANAEVCSEETVDRTWLRATQPVLKVTEGDTAASLTSAQCQLLCFFRFLMPVRGSGSQQRSCGYGVWLFASLVAMDTPLDPDTDRLVHDLFRTLCDQVRVLGEWMGVKGDRPGVLLEALDIDAGDSTGELAKSYTSLKDIKRADLLAVYTLIIVLAKLFRQNQNRLIPL